MNPNKTCYPTNYWSEYRRSLQSRGGLTVWMLSAIPVQLTRRLRKFKCRRC